MKHWNAHLPDLLQIHCSVKQCEAGCSGVSFSSATWKEPWTNTHRQRWKSQNFLLVWPAMRDRRFSQCKRLDVLNMAGATSGRFTPPAPQGRCVGIRVSRLKLSELHELLLWLWCNSDFSSNSQTSAWRATPTVTSTMWRCWTVVCLTLHLQGDTVAVTPSAASCHRVTKFASS